MEEKKINHQFQDMNKSFFIYAHLNLYNEMYNYKALFVLATRIRCEQVFEGTTKTLPWGEHQSTIVDEKVRACVRPCVHVCRIQR